MIVILLSYRFISGHGALHTVIIQKYSNAHIILLPRSYYNRYKYHYSRVYGAQRLITETRVLEIDEITLYARSGLRLAPP